MAGLAGYTFYLCWIMHITTQRTLICLLAILSISVVHAQLYFDGTIPVERNGVALALPWGGGINFSQSSMIDLDQDGLDDIFLFDRDGNAITTLLATGGAGTAGYRHTREFDDVWPFRELHDWTLLRDYNCDGKADIFSYSQAGFSVYKNTSTPADGLQFEQLTFRANCNYVFTDGSSQITNLYVSSEDLPGLADVDGDGDLDVITFSQLGSFVQYYKNLSLETYGSCDSLKFELRNACWGRFSENASTNAVSLNAVCPTQVPFPEVTGQPGGARGTEDEEDSERAHSGSTVTPLDLTGDGVMDLLLGDISFNNLVALTNGGTVDNSLMVSVDDEFPSYDQTLDLPIFPAAFHLDIDKDGKRDLLASPNSRSLAHNFEGMWFYHNSGTDAAPVFEFQQNDLFQDRMLDFGEGAYPVPFDHNGDGLMDLIVANAGYYNPADPINKIGSLALLENTGTATAPAFNMITDDYMGLRTSGIGEAMYPAFADIDGDGDQDMYVADLLGHLHFYRNVPSGNVAGFTLAMANVTDAGGSVIDMGRLVTPQFTDLDEDGLMDLIAGEQNGNLNYYRNTGSTITPEWTLVTDSLGFLRTNDLYTQGYSVPFIYRNAQGEREILVGSERGTLWHYTDIEGNLDGDWTLQTSDYMGLDEGGKAGLCLYDFTGDGELDLVFGNARGGLSFWRSDLISGVPSLGMETAAPMVYPNPSNGMVQLTISGTVPIGGQWVVRNSIGQRVKVFPIKGASTLADLNDLPNGLYTIRGEGKTMTKAVRLVLSH